MPRSRIIFFVIIGVALLIAVGATIIGPKLQQIGTTTSATTTAQYTSDNITTIRVVYGTEKQEWFKEAITRFTAANPDVKINAVGQGSMDSYQALSQVTDAAKTMPNGDAIPAVWSPAATIQINLLNDNNQAGRKLAINCQRLVLSPLVIMTWEDRAKVFDAFYKDKGGISFGNLAEAVDPAGKVHSKWANMGDATLWSTLGLPGGDADPTQWGFLKFGHTDPQSSNSGVMMLVAMANNYYARTGVVSVGDVTSDKFIAWLTTVEKAAATPLISSTGLFVSDVIVKGPSTYDMVVGYEALAIENFKNAVGRQAQGLRITYPPFNLYSDHPMCIIDHPSVTQRQRDAAKRFQDFLLTAGIQKLALTYGFRPADPNIPIFGANSGFDDPDLKKAGLSANVGQEIQIPDGGTIQNLVNTWRHVFKQ